MHIYRWDLDKTYIETEFGSMRALLRAALEPATSKRNTPGSAALLRALIDTDPGCRVAILSGSPTQMRKVLEEKLSLDGVRFDSLTLKDNLGNLRRGRLRAVKGQLGYKLPTLLQQRTTASPADTETLFGDDAEVDALIYTVYADAISGRMSPSEVREVLVRGGAYPDDVERGLAALAAAPRSDAVEDIFIRLDAQSPISHFEPLGTRVVPVYSWLQAAVVLWRRERLDTGGLVGVLRACMVAGPLHPLHVAGLLQDAARRRLVEADRLRSLVVGESALEDLQGPVLRSLDLLGEPPPAPLLGPADPLAFLDRSRG